MTEESNALDQAESLDLPRGEIAYELDQNIKTLVASAATHFYALGVAMKEMRDNEYWKDLGCSSFSEYYADPDLGFKKSSIYHAIKIVETFEKPEEIQAIPTSKIIKILPHVTPENKEDMVAMAKTLSGSDLEHQLKIKRISEANPELDIQTFPKIYPCNVCGQAKGISFIEMCHCGWTSEQVKRVQKVVKQVQQEAMG